MTSAEIRQSFIDFFAARGHRVETSAPLVPHGDQTLLFTNAGMVPFKDLFVGAAEPASPRAVSVQKCLRVSGKHNDLENVGPSPRHHTFFEMLGNFSFGDYFKSEAIDFAWELVTGGWGLSPEHLFATVYEEDDESHELWRKISSLPAERILRRGAKDNFWAMGETGPCGPCSEIFVDMAPDLPQVDWDTGSENGRYLEIWNLVFMQFDRAASGELSALPDPSIDTGAGLERVAAVLQGLASNYDTDLFQPILKSAADLAGHPYGAAAEHDISLRVIADHLRAVTFLLADGVIPGNEGRGYVLRRILRRAVRHGMSLGFEEPFLHRLVPVLGEVMGDHYPELAATAAGTTATVQAEEVKFLATVASASRQVQEAVDLARRESRTTLDGETVFRLYDTYGLPIDLIREIADEERIGVDEAGFETALERQRHRSRAAVGEGHVMTAVAGALRQDGEAPQTEFVGYGQLAVDDAAVVAVVGGTDAEAVSIDELAAGRSGAVFLDRTPFYAESGGEVADRGRLVWEGGEARVLDVQKDSAGIWSHFVEVGATPLRRGCSVRAEVDPGWRLPTQRNHTATHLLHAALRRVLGTGVRQAGSLVAPDHLRFDFTFQRPLTEDERSEVERLVNRWVLEAQEIVITAGRSYDEAVAAGAMALFGEKYGDEVRTVEAAGFLPGDEAAGRLRSLELCGGCHVRNSGEIGPFVILAERGTASGVRRIEALTGFVALEWLDKRRRLVAAAAGGLGVEPDRIDGEIHKLRERQRELERELSELRLQMVAGGSGGSLGDGFEGEVGGVRVLVREVPSAPANEIRNMADVLRSRLGSGVVVLATRGKDKVGLVTAVSKDLTGRLHAGRLAGRIAELVGGRGGGRADFAQAGGRRPEALSAALDAVPGIVGKTLEEE